MLLELFIKAGWYTVPLQGELVRLENGKKSLPEFPKNWKTFYKDNFNEEVVPLAGVITGEKSQIVAIDCDNNLTYSLFRAMDPDYAFHFVSKGKPEGGGTIIYRYAPKVKSFRIHNDSLSIDFFGNEGFVYLPTENNFTKESWEGMQELPPIADMPDTILVMLQTFAEKNADVKPTQPAKHTISNRLAPLLEAFVKNQKYDPVLFRILTPYSFRDLPFYVARGHLHPNDVPKGRGSEYLSKISAIIGADISVNIELYTNTMMLINSLWKGPNRPKTDDVLMSTIISPMIEGKSNVNGDVIWQYDPHWMQMGFIATSLNGDYIESFFDDIKGLYYLVNYTVPYIKSFTDKSGIISTIRTLLGRNINEQQYDTSKQLIRTMLSPAVEFGHIAGSDAYNLFRQTPELAVLNNPTFYRTQYTRPKTILRYLESLIPDDKMREYVIRFTKTKLSTFKYSPVVLYFIGKPGSGKDTFVGILRTIIGMEYVAKPDTKVFLEQYNGWMIDKFLIQLDEYGDKLSKHSDKQECIGKIKAYTGAPEMQIRAMRADGFNYMHSTTFIVTANRNPLPIDVDDRRFTLIKTPNILAKEDWVKEHGGITLVQENIKNEILDFCYYLATEVKTLPMDEYVIAPDSPDKDTIIVAGLPAAEQIVHYIKHNRFDELANLAMEYDIIDFTMDWDKCKLWDDKLAELYDKITEGNGHHRTVIKKLKEIGITRAHTTRYGKNTFYWFLDGLYRYKDYVEVKTVTAEQSKIKGLA